MVTSVTAPYTCDNQGSHSSPPAPGGWVGVGVGVGGYPLERTHHAPPPPTNLSPVQKDSFTIATSYTRPNICVCMWIYMGLCDKMSQY